MSSGESRGFAEYGWNRAGSMPADSWGPESQLLRLAGACGQQRALVSTPTIKGLSLFAAFEEKELYAVVTVF